MYGLKDIDSWTKMKILHYGDGNGNVSYSIIYTAVPLANGDYCWAWYDKVPYQKIKRIEELPPSKTVYINSDEGQEILEKLDAIASPCFISKEN